MEVEELYKDKESESYRDKIATIDEDGNRVWIYPKKPSGWFHNRRLVVSLVLLTFLFSGPFIRIGGQPLLMLNVLERKFVIFGQVFWPQDFHLAAIALITLVFSIVLFTVVFGRVFCGWICPQTIFMEMVFRKIEYAIEGDWKKQQKLNKQPWNQEKIIKKTSKHIIFYAMAFLVFNTFLAYIVGSEKVIEMITSPPTENLAAFSAIVLFSTAFYVVFSQVREQVCTTICPYGRLQGVLLDKQSINVTYDYVRGETRSKFRKNEIREEVGKGDCIDCHACVHVCPTGIDIRNGVQLECVNCTACIDACDDIMEKIDKPKGLIRYASEESIEKQQPFKLSTRGKGYTVLLFILIGILTTLLVTRTDVETSILRTPGIMQQTMEDGRVSNLYNFKIINKSNRELPITLKVENLEGEIKMVGEDFPVLDPQERFEQAMFIILDKSQVKGVKTNIKIGIYAGDELLESVKTNFLGSPQ